MRRWLFSVVALAAAVVGCVAAEVRVRDVPGALARETRFDTTYEKLLPLAEAGDPEVQNLLGFMFFHGEAVEQNFELAHDLFHKAAEQGNTAAQRNLGIFHAGGAPDVPARFRDAREANRWLSLATAGDPRQTDRVKAVSARYDVLSSLEESLEMVRGGLDIGEKVFATFCAGCHGFDGIAAYAPAPSFALGEVLQKSDEELTRSIRDGKNIMPSWQETLSDELIGYTLQFIRAAFGTAGGAPVFRRDWRVASNAEGEHGDGEHAYMRFCAGCHGFNGVAYYVQSPSFALGERMEKSDSELEGSVGGGKGIMPAWGAMLTQREIREVVAFVRSLERTFQEGIGRELRGAPKLYFRFRSLSEHEGQWYEEPVR